MTRAHHTSPFFFFNDTATTEIYTLSLHDALPISREDKQLWGEQYSRKLADIASVQQEIATAIDRKSTRLNSSHLVISYAVFCLKKKNGNVEEVGAYLIEVAPGAYVWAVTSLATV